MAFCMDFWWLWEIEQNCKLNYVLLKQSNNQRQKYFESWPIPFQILSAVLSVTVSRKQQPHCLIQATKSGITLPKIGFLVTGGRFRSKVLELWSTDGWQSTKHQSLSVSALNQKPSYWQLCTDWFLDRRHNFLHFYSYKFCNYIYWITVL